MKRYLFILIAAMFLVACSNKIATESKEASTEEQQEEEAENEPVEEVNTEVEEIETVDDEESEGEDAVEQEVEQVEEESGEDELDPQSEAELNAEEHPATPGKKLYDEEFKGMQYYFKGELVKTELVEGLFGEIEEALLVKNDEGFILVIFPNYEIPVNAGDEVEAWGPLSGDGYASSDLGVDNVVGVTGAMNASIINVNGEMQ